MEKSKSWEIFDILTLISFGYINNENIRFVINEFESMDEFFNSNSPLSKKLTSVDLFGNKLSEAKLIADQQLKSNSKKDGRIIPYFSPEYPSLLKEIAYPPVLIFTKGQLENLTERAVSIVGTRKCSIYGKLTTERFADYFAKNSISVVSGLAYGIDMISHLTTIKSGGKTFAVIASGLDCISSSEQQKTADKIIETGGAIISEYRFGTQALPPYFPQRNRIISGLTKATLVIESGLKGGALITAKFAFDQQREVFAVPGNISSEKSAGTNMLIKKNMASIAISPDTVIEDIGFEIESGRLDFQNEIGSKLAGTQKVIFDSINHEPIQVDQLSQNTGLEISELLVKLLDLEFKGLIRQLPGKYYIRMN